MPDEKRAYIVSHPTELETVDEQLYELLRAISNDISNYDETTISNKLYELGLEKTYAMLFVKNMIEQAPTIEYQLRELSKFTDDEFKTKFPLIINEIWVEQKKPQLLTKEQNITPQQLRIIFNLTRILMTNLSRSLISEKKLIEMCKSSSLSDSKTKTLINTLKINSEHWRNMVIFSNTQDSFFSLQNIAQQNALILRTMQEILGLLKRGSPDHQHFQ